MGLLALNENRLLCYISQCVTNPRTTYTQTLSQLLETWSKLVCQGTHSCLNFNFQLSLLKSSTWSKLNLSQNKNPYTPPLPLKEDAIKPATGILRALVYIGGSGALGLLVWAILLVLLFGESSATWPGFACAIPAIVGCGVVTYAIERCSLRTGMLFLVYSSIDFTLFIVFIAYMFYWRIYLYNPTA